MNRKQFHVASAVVFTKHSSIKRDAGIRSYISRYFPTTEYFRYHHRMPYMNLPNFTYSVPYCNTSEKLRLAEDLQKDLLWEGKGWHPASCNCENSSSCSQYLYETNSDTFARHDDCAQYKVITNYSSY